MNGLLNRVEDMVKQSGTRTREAPLGPQIPGQTESPTSDVADSVSYAGRARSDRRIDYRSSPLETTPKE